MSPRTRKRDEEARKETPRRECLCMGWGPELSEALRRLGVSEEAREHLRSARLEMLRAVRSVIDQRISDLSRPAARGTKVPVE